MADVCDDGPTDPTIVGWSRQMSAQIMWAATGRRYGVCTSTVRPCTKGCWTSSASREWWASHTLPIYGGGSMFGAWRPWFACGCGDSCSCSTIESFRLPGRPLSIVSVTIDGVVLNAAKYKLRGRDLLRVDGLTWPNCQNWGADPGTVGSWEVRMSHGQAVPIPIQIASGLYQCELARALTPGMECALPERVTNIVRDGVTVAFMDPLNFLNDGLTGVPLVDAAILSDNPGRLRRRPRAYRADGMRGAHRV